MYATFERMHSEGKAAAKSSAAPAVAASQRVAASKAMSVPATSSNKNIFDMENIMRSDDIDFEDFEEEEEEEEKDDGKDERKGDAREELAVDVNASDEAEMKYLVPPRSAGVSSDSSSRVSIEFTPRIFPTPLRESKVAEEEDWVAKNR